MGKKLSDDNPMKDMEPVLNTALASPEGISIVSLNFAIKWHDVAVIKDGAMYQAQKAEGKNIRAIGLEDVFETAALFERWLLAAPERLYSVLVEGKIEVTIPIKDGEILNQDET